MYIEDIRRTVETTILYKNERKGYMRVLNLRQEGAQNGSLCTVHSDYLKLLTKFLI